MALMNGGELLMRCLVEEGVKHVFGVPGSQGSTFIDAMCRLGSSEGIEFVMTRHEAAAAHMADAVSRTSDGVGVCTGTVGPGAINLATGVYVAYNDNIPMVVITPQIHSNRSYPFRGSMQQLDQKGLFEPITKWNAVVNRWDRIPEMVQRAFRTAASGRPGPVHLDFFVDVLFESHEEGEAKILSPGEYRTDARPAGDPASITKAVEMLLGAERPLIHVGGGVIRAKAWDELRELAEYLQVPVTTSVSGRGALPEDHPLLFVTKGGGAIMAEQNADVVLCVGTTMSEMDFWGEPPIWGDPAGQRFIYVDIDPEIIGLNRPISLGIVGDARLVLRQIIDVAKKESGPSPERIHIQEYRNTDDAMNAVFDEMAHSEAKPIHPLRLVRETVDFLARDGIMVLDGGNMALWTNIGGRIYQPRSFLVPEGTGQLGVGLPMALGAKMANPDKPVYIIHGDGAFMLNSQEIETAVRLKLPVIDIIGNDYAWGMIKGVQKVAFDSRYYGVEFTESRYDKLAESLGAKGIRVEDPADIRPALEEAAASDVMTVIDAVIDQEIHMCPPVVFDLVAELWLRGCDEPYCGG
jgi:acetolactate synthase I/II/III large subunit